MEVSLDQKGSVSENFPFQKNVTFLDKQEKVSKYIRSKFVEKNFL